MPPAAPKSRASPEKAEERGGGGTFYFEKKIISKIIGGIAPPAPPPPPGAAPAIIIQLDAAFTLKLLDPAGLNVKYKTRRCTRPGGGGADSFSPLEYYLFFGRKLPFAHF